MSDSFRDNQGRFLPGVAKPIGGRPPGAGQMFVKDACWESINKVALLIFNLPEIEMAKWVEENKKSLSLAERKYLESAQAPGGLAIIEALLDRIIGKTLKIDSGNTEKNPIIERLYTLSPGGVRREVDQLIRNRELINAERTVNASED